MIGMTRSGWLMRWREHVRRLIRASVMIGSGGLQAAHLSATTSPIKPGLMGERGICNTLLMGGSMGNSAILRPSRVSRPSSSSAPRLYSCSNAFSSVCPIPGSPQHSQHRRIWSHYGRQCPLVCSAQVAVPREPDRRRAESITGENAKGIPRMRTAVRESGAPASAAGP